MEMYLLKSAACLAVLMLFYKLLLERENMHVFKQFFLLAAPVISFVIPAITIPEYVTISSANTAFFTETGISSESQSFPYLEAILGTVYLLGVVFFGSIFLINFNTLIRRARNNPKIETPAATHVLLKDNVIPHTFWSYIYLNRLKFVRKEIPQEVLDHELAHVQQKHSADILFIELLQIFLWFLPLIYLLKKAVRLNHEFLADRSVLQKTENVVDYQKILLSFSSGQQNTLVNSINYQSIKKRFTVMKKQTSQKAVLLRTFIVLPLLATLLYSFSDREIVVVTPTADAKEIVQEKATPEMVAEYNKWVKYYKENESALVETKTWERMKYIYSVMTPAQKKNSEKFPSLHPKQIISIVEDKPEDNARINKEVKIVKKNDRAAIKRERAIIEEKRNANRQEREVVKEEREAIRREKEIERAERREKEIERRAVNGEIPPPPPPPPAPPVGEHLSAPPPPPPPPSPAEAVRKWMNEGATFFYNGKEVSGQQALEAVQKNDGKNLNVRVEENGSHKTVRISDKKSRG